jgi:NADH-quinone oxidoreductase subunit N
VIVAVLNSVVSVFYYLRVTVAMYMEEPQGEPTAVSRSIPAAIALGVAVALTLWWGIQAHGLLELAQRSVLGLM